MADDLYATADFCLIPMGLPESSVAIYIAQCQRVLEKSGLEYKVNSVAIRFEGDELKPRLADAVSNYINLSYNHAITRISGYGTNLEGPWMQVCEAIKACHEAVHQMGVPRIATDVRIGTRVDKSSLPRQANQDKVKRVEEILSQENVKRL